jgi:hypothetical protein
MPCKADLFLIVSYRLNYLVCAPRIDQDQNDYLGLVSFDLAVLLNEESFSFMYLFYQNR